MISPMNLMEREPVVGWEAVKPPSRGKPAEYVRAQAELEAAWNEHTALVDLYLSGRAVWADVLAAEAAVLWYQKYVGRIYERWMNSLAAAMADECTCQPDAVSACPSCQRKITIRLGNTIPFEVGR